MPINAWYKSQYIVELAQWLYAHEYPLSRSIELCEWAVDLMSASPCVEQSSSLASANIAALVKSIQDGGANQQRNNARAAPTTAREDWYGNNRLIDWESIGELKALEALVRVHVTLARMVDDAAHNLCKKSAYLRKACAALKRLFHQAFVNGVEALKELPKQMAAGGDSAQADNSSKAKVKHSEAAVSVASKKVNSAKESIATTTAGKKSRVDNLLGGGGGGSGLAATTLAASATQFPQTVEQWSRFELSDEIAATWSHELMRTKGLNAHTAAEPYLLFHYLEMLGSMLAEMGHSAAPLFLICHAQLALVNHVIKLDASGGGLYLYFANISIYQKCSGVV